MWLINSAINSECRFSSIWRTNNGKIPNTNLSFKSVIGDLVEDRRKELGLSIAKLVQKLGYEDIELGCVRYNRFIAGGTVPAVLGGRLPLEL